MLCLLCCLELEFNTLISSREPAQSSKIIGEDQSKQSLSIHRKDDHQSLARQLIEYPTQCGDLIQRLLGLMASTAYVLLLAQLRMCLTQLWLLEIYRLQLHPLSGKSMLPFSAILTFSWWIDLGGWICQIC